MFLIVHVICVTSRFFYQAEDDSPSSESVKRASSRQAYADESDEEEKADDLPDLSQGRVGALQNGRRTGGIPRTVPLFPTYTGRIAAASPSNRSNNNNADTNGNSTNTPPPPPSFTSTRAMNPNFTGPASPLRPTATGTRYGAALTGNWTGTLNLNGPLSPTRNLGGGGGTRPLSPTKPLSPLSTGSTTSSGGWSGRAPPPMPGSGTPLCARCSKPVYFAEQVKASGKTFHKPCLRCTECNTSLDSNRLTEKDGQVVCRSCYSKVRVFSSF